jgi:hypothetical protein
MSALLKRLIGQSVPGTCFRRPLDEDGIERICPMRLVRSTDVLHPDDPPRLRQSKEILLTQRDSAYTLFVECPECLRCRKAEPDDLKLCISQVPELAPYITTPRR